MLIILLLLISAMGMAASLNAVLDFMEVVRTGNRTRMAHYRKAALHSLLSDLGALYAALFLWLSPNP